MTLRKSSDTALLEAAPRRPNAPCRDASRDALRVAFVAGTLVQDGAEKQLVYMSRALREAGVNVRVYSLTRGEFYEGALAELGLRPHFVGRSRSRLRRLLTISAALRDFRPHVVQSAHFYTNLYATLPARLCHALALGCCRNDVFSEIKDLGGLGELSLRLPVALLVNSRAARRNAQSLGIPPHAIHVLNNVIDLESFDRQTELDSPTGQPELDVPDEHSRPVALAIGRLVEQKRFDRFLAALAKARCSAPRLKGILVGEGPNRGALEERAKALGLLPYHVAFLGRRRDVPALLERATMLVLSSDYEGFPNVVLEAMSARLPVVTTPAGDAADVLQDEVAGYVVSFDDIERMAVRMAQLADSPDLRRRFGEAGRARAERRYNYAGLAARLLRIYRIIALRRRRHDLLRLLPPTALGERESILTPSKLA